MARLPRCGRAFRRRRYRRRIALDNQRRHCEFRGVEIGHRSLDRAELDEQTAIEQDPVAFIDHIAVDRKPIAGGLP